MGPVHAPAKADGLVLQPGQGGGDGHAGDGGELIQQGGALRQLRYPKGAQHAVAELEGAGGGDHHGVGGVPRLPAVLLQHMESHGGVGIDEVAVLLPHPPDDLLGFSVAAEACGEKAGELFADGFVHLVPPRPAQLGHIVPHTGIVMVRQGKEQPLQIGGDQDVHRGRHGVVEGAVAVVHAGL